jgi:hypothetical protein
LPVPPLAFRPASVLKRLPGASRACPLSLRDVAGALLAEAVHLPIVLEAGAAPLRAALVAAKEAGSVLGVTLPAGLGPERWFDAVAAEADRLAPGLPLLVAAPVRLLPGDGVEAMRARRLVHRLVDAGVTHLVLDLDALPADARAEEAARAADPALELGLGVECLLPAAPGGLPEPEDAFALLAELGSLGATPDLAGVRCPAPEGAEGAAAQAERLRALAEASGGVALCRRGPGAAEVARRLADGVVRAWDDGGLAAATGAGGPASGAAGGAAGEGAGTGPARARAGSEDGQATEAAEARAYAAVAAFLDAIGAAGSADVLSAALARAREA